MTEHLKPERDTDFLEKLRKYAQQAKNDGSVEVILYGSVDLDFYAQAMSRENAEDDRLKALLEEFLEEEGLTFELEVQVEVLSDDCGFNVYRFLKRKK